MCTVAIDLGASLLYVDSDALPCSIVLATLGNCGGNTLCPINKVTLRWAWSTGQWPLGTVLCHMIWENSHNSNAINYDRSIYIGIGVIIIISEYCTVTCVLYSVEHCWWCYTVVVYCL